MTAYTRIPEPAHASLETSKGEVTETMNEIQSNLKKKKKKTEKANAYKEIYKEYDE